jgi:hypothetical protein
LKPVLELVSKFWITPQGKALRRRESGAYTRDSEHFEPDRNTAMGRETGILEPVLDRFRPPPDNPAMKKPKKGRKAEPEPLSSILARIGRIAGLPLDPEARKIWETWEDAVGRKIAKNAQPEAIKGGLLIVAVASAPWAQELEFLKKEICERVNRSVGKDVITDIRFKVGG